MSQLSINNRTYTKVSNRENYFKYSNEMNSCMETMYCLYEDVVGMRIIQDMVNTENSYSEILIYDPFTCKYLLLMCSIESAKSLWNAKIKKEENK